MWSGERFIVRRSPWMLAFQIVAAFVFIALGLYALTWMQPPPTPGQAVWAWLSIAGGMLALLVLGHRATQPAELLAIDATGLTWWKADRTILWAEIARISLDSYRSTFYLHVKLGAGSGGVGTDPAHPIEAFGTLLTNSDLSFRLSGSNTNPERVRDALEQLAPEHVRILPERDY